MQTNLIQCAAYGLSTDRLTSHPFFFCSNAGRTHTSIFPYTTSGYDAEHVHSTSLVDHGEACWTAVWSWPQCCRLVSAYLQSSYSLSHLYVEQQFLFSDPQRVLCHEVPCWTSSDQYERVRVITTNWTHLLPIHTWDFGTLTSRMPPGRENG